MKKLSRYLTKLRSKTGIIVGLMVFLLFSQQINYHQEQIKEPVTASSSQDNQDNQDNQEDDAGKSTMITTDQDIIASVIQFNVNHVFYVIMNIEQDEEEDTFENTGLNSLPDEIHKVLFCQVISPNAP